MSPDGRAIASLRPGDDWRGLLVRRRAMASQLTFHAAFDKASGVTR